MASLPGGDTQMVAVAAVVAAAKWYFWDSSLTEPYKQFAQQVPVLTADDRDAAAVQVFILTAVGLTLWGEL